MKHIYVYKYIYVFKYLYIYIYVYLHLNYIHNIHIVTSWFPLCSSLDAPGAVPLASPATSLVACRDTSRTQPGRGKSTVERSVVFGGINRRCCWMEFDGFWVDFWQIWMVFGWILMVFWWMVDVKLELEKALWKSMDMDGE